MLTTFLGPLAAILSLLIFGPCLLCSDIFSSAPQNLNHEKLAQPQDSNAQPGYSFSTHTPK
jgi:hypothetical protein